jgi:hypothetical protein
MKVLKSLFERFIGKMRHFHHQKIKCIVVLNRLCGRVASVEAASRRLSEAACQLADTS